MVRALSLRSALVAGAIFFTACSSEDGTDPGAVYQKPQILPDNNPVCLSDRVIEAGDTWNQPILLQNKGKETLQIATATIAGDTRHTFELLGPEPASVPSLEFATLQLRYRPTEAGWDAALVRVTSNAENYPTLELYVIARAVPQNLDGGAFDAGPRPAEIGEALCTAVRTDAGQ